MNNKDFLISFLKAIVSWPIVILILGLRIIDSISPNISKSFSLPYYQSTSIGNLNIDFNVLLSILSILLATIALMPYIIEIYFYFNKRPKFEIQIANKKTSSRNKKTVFDFWLGIKPQNVSILLKRVILSLPFDIIPEQYPNSTKRINIIPPIEDTEFGPTILLDYGGVPYYPKSVLVHMLRVASTKKFDFIKATLTIESEIDILKMGIWSIFYRAREYRNQKTINILIDDKRQEIII